MRMLRPFFRPFREWDAVVAYHPDQGEEVFDYRDYMGRSHESVAATE